MSTLNLRKKRHGLVEKSREMLSAENITAADLKTVEKMQDEIDVLENQIRQQDGPNGVGCLIPPGATEGCESGTDFSGSSAGNSWRTNDGRSIRCLAGSERLQGADNSYTLGRTIKSVITGKPDPDFDVRTQVGGQDSTGGYLLNEPAGERFIDLARAASVVSQAGANTLTLPEGYQRASMAKLTADPSVQLTAEGGTIPVSSATFGEVNVRLRKITCLVSASRELIEYSDNAAMVIEDTLRSVVGAEMDRAALLGDGDGEEPEGLANMSGIGSITSVGDVNHIDILNAIKTVANANHTANAGIWSPGTQYELDILQDSQNQYLVPPAAYEKLKKFNTTKTGDTAAYVGDFSKLFFAVSPGGIMIDTSNQGDGIFNQDLIQFRAIVPVDIFATNEAAFCALTGLS